MTAAIETLLEEVAVAELAAILDSAPPDDEVLAKIHWAEANATRARKLEEHILAIQQAPHTCLLHYPLSDKEPPMPVQKKLATRLAEYQEALEWVKASPSAKDYLERRQRAYYLSSLIPGLARSEGVKVPTLDPIPANPYAESPAPEPKAKKGKEVAQAEVVEQELSAGEIASHLSHNFWALCQKVEALSDREAIRPALDVLHSRLQVAYGLLDEVVVEKGA